MEHTKLKLWGLIVRSQADRTRPLGHLACGGDSFSKTVLGAQRYWIVEVVELGLWARDTLEELKGGQVGGRGRGIELK